MEKMSDLGDKFGDISRDGSERNVTAQQTFSKLSGSVAKLGVKQANQIGKLRGLTGQLEPFVGKCKIALNTLDEYNKQAKNLKAKTGAWPHHPLLSCFVPALSDFVRPPRPLTPPPRDRDGSEGEG